MSVPPLLATVFLLFSKSKVAGLPPSLPGEIWPAIQNSKESRHFVRHYVVCFAPFNDGLDMYTLLARLKRQAETAESTACHNGT